MNIAGGNGSGNAAFDLPADFPLDLPADMSMPLGAYAGMDFDMSALPHLVAADDGFQLDDFIDMAAVDDAPKGLPSAAAPAAPAPSPPHAPHETLAVLAALTGSARPAPAAS